MNVNVFSVDGYIADVMAEYLRGFHSVDEYVADVMNEFLRGIHSYDTDDDVVGNMMDGNKDDDKNVQRVHKERVPNAYPYKFGNVFEASWYLNFLHQM